MRENRHPLSVTFETRITKMKWLTVYCKPVRHIEFSILNSSQGSFALLAFANRCSFSLYIPGKLDGFAAKSFGSCNPHVLLSYRETVSF